MQSLPTVHDTTGVQAGSDAARMRRRASIRGHAAALALALVLGLPFTSAPARADDLAEVQSLVRQGNLAQATDRLNVFLAKNPKDARGRFLRGLILTEQKRPADAIRVFLALTEDYPELPEPYNNLAVLYASQGQFDRARQMLESAIRTHPSYATAHENLGDIYAKMASEAYDRALQLDRSNAGVQTKLALIRELFSTNPKFQRAPLTGETPKQVAIAGAAGAGPAAQPAKGVAGPAPAAPATNRVVVAREPAAAAADAQAAQARAAGAAAAASAAAATSAAAAALPPQAPAAAPAATPISGSEEVLRTVEQWAAAWSGNDVNRYLAFYAKDFKVPGGDSRADWEQSRRERIAKPKKIEVRVSSPQVKPLGPNRMAVAFRQDYRSATLKSSAPKTLILVRVGERWLIEQEQVGR